MLVVANILMMKSHVSCTLAAAVVVVASASAQEDLSQFSPAQQFGYGQFLLSKAFVEIVSSPSTADDPEAAADKIDKLRAEAETLRGRVKGKVDQAELMDIMRRLIVTPEYQDVQKLGAIAGEKLKSTNYYNSEVLRTAIQQFFFTVMGMQAV